MNQLQLNLILPPSDVGRNSLPTSEGYQPDWELEQEGFFEGDRVLYRGKPATIKKVWPTRTARIWTDKDFKVYTVSFDELEAIADTVEVGNVVGREEVEILCPLHRLEIAESVRDSVGRENEGDRCLPTQKCPSDGHLTFEIGRKYYLKTDGRAVFLEKLYKKRAKVCDRENFDSFKVNLDDLSETSIQLSLPQEASLTGCSEKNNVGREVPGNLLPRQRATGYFSKGERCYTDSGLCVQVLRVYKNRILVKETVGKPFGVAIGELRHDLPLIKLLEQHGNEAVPSSVGQPQHESMVATQEKRILNYQKQLEGATSQKAKNKIERHIEDCRERINNVGREAPVNLLPTQDDVGREVPKNLLPTHFYKAVEDWDLSSLYQMKAYLEHKIRERGYSVVEHSPAEKSCREKKNTENLLPTQNVGRKEFTESLPTSSNNNDYPYPYIEVKRLPYKTKSGEKKYRKNPYYFLRDHHDKGKSKYLCSKRENIPEELLGLKIYGEDEIPF